MENNSIEQNEKIESNFCDGCLFIIKNVNLISKQNELSEVIKTDSLNDLSSIINTHNKFCKFCAGILNIKNFSSIYEKIRNSIKLYDHVDYKITTNFSPLFAIIHNYKLKYPGIEASDCENLDISLIRKVFKPFFIPYLEEQFANEGGKKEEHNLKSEMEIKIVFEFEEKFYDKVFETFSFIPNVKKMGIKKFRPDGNIDKGVVNELVRNCSSDLFIELVSKNNLLSELKEETFTIKVEIVNAEIYVRGCYLKFSRDVGQSPWEINGVKICESSVQDEMRNTLLKIFRCDDCIMSAGGREDRDVRMLGQGRPFIMAIVNPKVKYAPLMDIKLIEDEINKNTHLIEVKNLTNCDKNYYAVLKKYEDSKMKSYTCLVYTSKIIADADIERINCIKNLALTQKTPIRVMHRRTLMDRQKTIFTIDAKKINDNFMIVNVLASAGTYIKEFIHSDLNRTYPSLITLLDCDCDILQLDVLDIVYEN